MIGDSSGAVYDSPVHQALGLHTDFAEDSPNTDPSSVVSYDDSKSPENNWNELSPQDRENTQNSWNYNPGNIVPYGDIKKEAPGGMFFSPDYQHQDYIERLKNEHDYEHYKDEKGNQFLMPKAKAPLVGSLEGMTKLAGDIPTPDTPESNPFEVAANRTKQSVKPESGRQEGWLTKIPEAMALDIVGRGANSVADIPSFINDMMERQPGQDFSEKEAGRAFNIATLLSGQPGTAGNAELNMGLKLGGKASGDVSLIKKTQMKFDPQPENGYTRGGEYTRFQIKDENNKSFGNLETTYIPEDKTINIEWIGNGRTRIGSGDIVGKDPNKFLQSLGPSKVRSLILQLKEEYPEAKTISGFRVSGARAKASATGQAELKIPLMERFRRTGSGEE